MAAVPPAATESGFPFRFSYRDRALRRVRKLRPRYSYLMSERNFTIVVNG